MTATPTPARRQPSSAKPVRRPGDLFFSSASIGSATIILLTLAGVAVFLLIEALPALTAPADGIAPARRGVLDMKHPLRRRSVRRPALRESLATA